MYVVSPVKKGFLKKQGHLFKTWKRRYFILRGPLMAYYESDDVSSKELGTIFVAGATVDDLPEHSKPHVFLITQATVDKPYVISCPDAASKKEWIDAIKEASAHYL
jgi:PH domain